MLGDDGGGYWIGRRALAIALRAHDGRGGSAALRAAAEARFGPLATIARRGARATAPRRRRRSAPRAAAEARFGPLAQIARAVYDAPDPVATVAAFTRDVADLARAGDAAAAAILAAAGAELARTVTAAIDRTLRAGGRRVMVRGRVRRR